MNLKNGNSQNNEQKEKSAKKIVIGTTLPPVEKRDQFSKNKDCNQSNSGKSDKNE